MKPNVILTEEKETLLWYRAAFALANLFPVARNAQRILVYTCP